MTDWPTALIVEKPLNGTPFVSVDDWNATVDGIRWLDEHLSVMEALYAGGGIPLGSATLWYGTESTIPAGWQICDGSNGTQDLRGKFLMGASLDADLGVTGGSETHVHTGGAVASGGAHVHTPGSKTTGGISGSTGVTGSGSWITGNAHTHNITPTIQSAGAHDHTLGLSGAADGLPPYKKLFWIARIP